MNSHTGIWVVWVVWSGCSLGAVWVQSGCGLGVVWVWFGALGLVPVWVWGDSGPRSGLGLAWGPGSFYLQGPDRRAIALPISMCGLVVPAVSGLLCWLKCRSRVACAASRSGTAIQGAISSSLIKPIAHHTHPGSPVPKCPSPASAIHGDAAARLC